MPLNPSDFDKGTYIQSVHTAKVYEIIEPNKKGMAVLINEDGQKEDWNALNNSHFVKFTGQIKMKLT